MVFYCYIIKHKFSILKKKAPFIISQFLCIRSPVQPGLTWIFPLWFHKTDIKLLFGSSEQKPISMLGFFLSPVVLSKLIQITGRFHFFLMLSMQPSTFFKKGICAESFSCFEYFCLLPASSPLKGSYNLHWAHLDNPG